MKNRQTLLTLLLYLSLIFPVGCSSTTVSTPPNNNAVSSSSTPVSSANNASGFQYEVRDLHHIEDGQRLRIFANVVNNGTAIFIGTHYQLLLHDNNGNVVATDQIQTQTDIVPPGKSSPIWFTLDNPPAWSHYEITIRQQGMRFGDFKGEVVNVSVTPATGNGNCGQYVVTNHDQVSTSFVFVAERYLDSNGRIRNVIVQGVGASTLSPGESVTRSCFYADGPYELTAIAWRITD